MFQLHSYNETWELSKMHSYRKREIVLEQCFGSQCFPTLTNRSCVQPGSHFIVTEMCSIISLIPIIDSYSVSTFWQQSLHWKIHQTVTGCLKKATPKLPVMSSFNQSSLVSLCFEVQCVSFSYWQHGQFYP